MRHYIAGGISLLALTCAASGSLIAQTSLPTARELLIEKKLWFHSANAAGAVFDNTSNYSDVRMQYGIQRGDFHRPQEGETTKSALISSQGFLDLKSAYVWGAFSFEQRNLTDAGYNASITDPFRGMPYYVVDSHRSKWRNQYYDLKFRAASPLYRDRFAFGISGKYLASIATKQRDPRVDTRFYTLEIAPGVTYRIDDHHRAGLNALYESLKEDSQMSNVNYYTEQTFYSLYGLGHAVKQIGDGRVTNYFGNRIGGNLQYNYRSGPLSLLTEVGTSLKVEHVDLSFSTPIKDASVKEHLTFGAIALSHEGTCFDQIFRAGISTRHIDGIQYLSQRDNSEAQEGWITLHRNIRSTYQYRTASLDYALIRRAAEEYRWRADAHIIYNSIGEKYLLPHSYKNARNLTLGLSGTTNLSLHALHSSRLLLRVRTAYRRNLSGGYHYNGPHPDFITVTGLETEDTNYLTSNALLLGADLTYSQSYRNTRTHLFAKASFDHTKGYGHDFGKRELLSISIGVNF